MIALVRTLVGIVVAPLVVWLGRVISAAGQATSTRVSRRLFLRNAVLGGVGIILLEIAGATVYLLWPNKTSAFGTKITVAKSSLPAVGAPPYRYDPGKFYLINNDDGMLALYWRCPHLGCTVPWSPPEDKWHCPCHGSIYNRHGERIAGPAPRPMDLMALSFDNSGNAVVDTGKITQRTRFEPEQAVKPPA